jgi:iron-sulfur cluster assembly accessory protein
LKIGLRDLTLRPKDNILITLTEKAQNKVKAFTAAEGQATNKGLRIYVKGGGCSGFEYGFSLDEEKEGDNVLQVGEIKVLIDAFSAPYVMDSTVDYVEDFRGAGFTVKNPNAKSTCGCGSSFSV